MPFHVIRLDTKQPYTGFGNGNIPMQWDTGAAAAEAADALTNRDRDYGIKWKPLRIKTDPETWKRRERERFANGTYTKLPWHDCSWWHRGIGPTEHFAHVSNQKPAMVAFTANEEHGQSDIHTRIKAGTYLERYYSKILSKVDIQVYASDFAARYGHECELKFATTADEIARVYINGPRSCMSGPETGLYHSPFHPCRIYAAGDLAVAYIERGRSITARSLCWPDKKLYYNIYGDLTRLRPLLEKAGYKTGSLIGAKLQRVQINRGGTPYFVCPHIDGVGRITDMGDHLITGGNISATTTSGIVSAPNGVQCTSCLTWGHQRADLTPIQDIPNSLFCTDCVRINSFVCAATGVRYGNRANVYVMGYSGHRYYWSIEYFRQHGFICAGSRIYLPKTEAVTMDDGQLVSKQYFSRECFRCTNCNKNRWGSQRASGQSLCAACDIKQKKVEK